MTKIISFIASIALCTGVAFADSAPLAPSAVVGSASTYDKQDVTVTGTVKNVTTQDGPRGPMTRYQLCDAQCVNVVQPGDGTAAPKEGATQTVTGRFRANVSHGHFQATNVIMVMPPGGWNPHN